jgi:hypothetical protein
MRSRFASLGGWARIILLGLAFLWPRALFGALSFDATSHTIALDDLIAWQAFAAATHTINGPIIAQERRRKHDMEIIVAAIDNVAPARAFSPCDSAVPTNMISIKPSLWFDATNGRDQTKAFFWGGWLGLTEYVHGTVLYPMLDERHGQTGMSQQCLGPDEEMPSKRVTRLAQCDQITERDAQPKCGAVV